MGQNGLNGSSALSYQRLRLAVGYLGMALPAMLVGYSLLAVSFQWPDVTTQTDGLPFEASISDYYYSQMGDIFVGTLCVLGVFLWFYDGHPNTDAQNTSPRWRDRLSDKFVARMAAIGAIGTALFPLRPPSKTAAFDTLPNTGLPHGIGADWLSGFDLSFSKTLHFGSALLYFVAMVLFCLVLFTRGNGTQDNKVMVKGCEVTKINWAPRNKFFAMCGWIIVACVALLGFYNAMESAGQTAFIEWADRIKYYLWVEIVAVLAFAQAWIEKARSKRMSAFTLFNRTP